MNLIKGDIVTLKSHDIEAEVIGLLPEQNAVAVRRTSRDGEGRMEVWITAWIIPPPEALPPQKGDRIRKPRHAGPPLTMLTEPFDDGGVTKAVVRSHGGRLYISEIGLYRRVIG